MAEISSRDKPEALSRSSLKVPSEKPSKVLLTIAEASVSRIPFRAGLSETVEVCSSILEKDAVLFFRQADMQAFLVALTAQASAFRISVPFCFAFHSFRSTSWTMSSGSDSRRAERKNLWVRASIFGLSSASSMSKLFPIFRIYRRTGAGKLRIPLFAKSVLQELRERNVNDAFPFGGIHIGRQRNDIFGIIVLDGQ